MNIIKITLKLKSMLTTKLHFNYEETKKLQEKDPGMQTEPAFSVHITHFPQFFEYDDSKGEGNVC